MRRIRRIAIVSSLVLVVLLAGLLTTAHIFKDDIIARVLAQVNENVDVPIAVSEVDFSLVHDFPNASVLFRDVFIADRFDEADTLLQSSLLTLEFDIWDMVNGRYTIDKIGLGAGRLKMRTLADGQVNYIFWKKPEESNPEMTFAIDRLELSDTRFTYNDAQADLSISSVVAGAEMRGKFSEGWMDMVVSLQGSETDILLGGLAYLKGNEVAFESKMRVNEAGHDIQFEDCVAEVGEVKTPLTGRIFKTEEWNLDLTLDGSLQIAEFLKELPRDQKGSLDKYHPSGKVDFLLTIKGESSERIHPKVDLAFDLRAGKVTLKEPASAIKKIKAKGRYTRNEKGVDKIQFAHFEGKVPQGEIAYTGLISDFEHPYVIGSFYCDADFADLMALSQQDVMNDMGGNIKVDLNVKGHLPTNKFDLSSKNRLALSGDAVLEDLEFELSGNGYSCSGINTRLVLEDNRLIIDALALIINDDPVQINGHIDGLWPFVLGSGHMSLVADVHAENIHWDRWAQAAKSEAGAATQVDQEISIQANFDIGAFTYSAFLAEEVTGKFALNDGRIDLNPLHFKSCKGTLDSRIQIEQSKDLYWATSCDAKIDGVDINQLFTQFDQFGQDFLTNKHLAGTGDASIHFEGRFSPAMNVDLKSVRTEANLRISDGELNQHPAMQDIVAALRERNLVKSFVRTDELEEELRHLRFNTLENKIKISDEVIYIPEMTIESNAMDIAIAGSHSFANKIDYTMEFNLRDILVNSSNPEFYIEDDGLGHVIPMRMYGTVDNPIIELDKDKTRENRKEALAQAKDDIRDFFSDPFGASNADLEKDDRSAVKVSLEGESPILKKSPKKKAKATKKKGWKLVPGDEDEDTIAEEEEEDF